MSTTTTPTSLETFLKHGMDDYAKKNMNYILDIVYVNGRSYHSFDPVSLLNAVILPRRLDVPQNWTLVYSIGDVDRLYLNLSEHLVNEHNVYMHVFNALSVKPVDFKLVKCVYRDDERFMHPGEVWSHTEAP